MFGIIWLDDGGVSSDEDLSNGDGDAQDGQSRGEDRELKDRLLRKFGSHIGSLKLEFSKKKKKGKLPKEARQTLLQWWNVHYKWPYPTVSKFHCFCFFVYENWWISFPYLQLLNFQTKHSNQNPVFSFFLDHPGSW